MILPCCRSHFRQRMKWIVLVVTVLVMLMFTLGFWASYNMARHQIQVIRETYERQLTQAVDQLGRMKK